MWVGGDDMGGERILVLDDNAVLAEVTARGLSQRGYEVCIATSGRAAIDLAGGTTFDLLLADVYLPEMNGLDTAQTIRAWQPDIVVIFMTGEGTLGLALDAIRRGTHGFLVKPFTHQDLALRVAEALTRSHLERENMRLRLLTPMLEATVGVLAAAIDVRDHLTASHASRLPRMAEMLARAAGLDDQAVDSVRRGALLHDIGKIGVADDILRKPGPLTAGEQILMRRHPEIGAEMVAHVNDLHATVDVIRHHHERWDGHGYPDGIAGEAIPVGARILAIVDAYDAMTSMRPYRPATTSALACAELRNSAGRQFDPALVDLFMQQFTAAAPEAERLSQCASASGIEVSPAPALSIPKILPWITAS